MAKRFTATDKWSDKWFRKLSPTLKLGWLYLTDSCDPAGVIELDEDLANFQVGADVDWAELVELAGSRIKRLQDEKLWITKFLSFQYGTLSAACPAHRPALQAIDKHGLSQYLSDSFLKAIGKVLDRERDKTKTRGGTGGKTFRRPTVEEIAAYCRDRQNGIDPQAVWDHYDAKGWKIGKTPMKDWQAAVRTWEAKRREDSTANVEVGCDPPAMRTTNPEKLRARGQG